MPNIFGVLGNDFWLSSFYDSETTNQAIQKLSSLDDQQIKELKAAYQENPFLFLRFNNKMLDELKKLGVDIVVDQNDQNKIFSITVESLMKQYDQILSSSKSYFDSVVGDGYCQTYATMQAFGLDPKTITKDNAKKIRKEIAEASALNFFQAKHFKQKGFDFKSFDEVPEKLLEDYLKDPTEPLFEYKELMGLVPKSPWARSGPIVRYFSKKYKRPTWDIATSEVYGSMLFEICNGAKFQDILYDCPVVVLNGGAHNHSINLKADRTERKKFALEFHNLFRDAIIADLFFGYNLYYNGANSPQMGFGVDFNFKNNFYEFTLSGLLNGLFKNIDKQEIITQLKNFFNGVPHKYENMMAIKLIFYIFDLLEAKILKPFNINTPESEFISANEFLSDVLICLKKDVIEKYPDLEKVFNHESKEMPEENKTEPEKPPKSEKTSDNPEPEPITNQTAQKQEANEQKNDQPTGKPKEDMKKVEPCQKTDNGEQSNNQKQLDKPKEDIKKDGTKDKDKPKSESSKKIFSGSKGLYIFLCIITFGIFYLFLSSPETKKDKPLLTKEDKNKTQNKNDKGKSGTDETKESAKTKPLQKANSQVQTRPSNEKAKSDKNQYEY